MPSTCFADKRIATCSHRTFSYTILVATLWFPLACEPLNREKSSAKRVVETSFFRCFKMTKDCRRKLELTQFGAYSNWRRMDAFDWTKFVVPIRQTALQKFFLVMSRLFRLIGLTCSSSLSLLPKRFFTYPVLWAVASARNTVVLFCTGSALFFFTSQQIF